MSKMGQEDITKSIGEKIAAIRKEKGISQVDLAFSIGIEDSALRRIEKGRTNPTIKTLLIIAKGLQVDIKDLFDFEKETNSVSIKEYKEDNLSDKAAEDKPPYKKPSK